MGRAEREYGITVALPAGTAASKEYSLTELMVIAGAREIADGEMVLVGMRLPMLAYLVAQRTHAPHAIGLYDNGIIRMAASSEPLHTAGDPSNVGGATQCGQTLDVMGYLQQGRVQVGFLGGAEVDRFRECEFHVGIARPGIPSIAGFGRRLRYCLPRAAQRGDDHARS